MARYFRRKKFCRFKAEGVEQIDYKDINLPVPARSINASYPRRSSAHVFWPCCLIAMHTSNRAGDK